MQQRLIDEWDGLPTTRFARHHDHKFSEEMKNRLRHIIESKFGITLSDPQEERKNPQEADNRISEAFALVKDWLRKNDKEAFWQIHNIDYGFYRNLWGSGGLWISLNIVFLVVSVMLYYNTLSLAFLYLILFNVIVNITTIMIITFYLPKATKFSAEQYAESAWIAFYNLSRE
ncbi:MAG: hypothetical protein WBD28_03660 [Candidatus Zixiibacteriota bacterium]